MAIGYASTRAGDGGGLGGRMGTESWAPSSRTGSEPNRFYGKGLPSTKSGTVRICSNGWLMSAKSRDAKTKRPNSAKRRNEALRRQRSRDKRSGAMNRAHAGAGRNSKNAAALDALGPEPPHSRPSIPHLEFRPPQT